MKKKIAIVTSHINRGGAGIAAQRLYDSLKKNKNIKVKIFDLTKSKSKKINFFDELFVMINQKISKYLSKNNFDMKFDFFKTKGIYLDLLIFRPDIIHLHWIGLGVFPMKHISKFKYAKIYWTLHDCLPFTKGCSYTQDCHNFYNGCSNCPGIKKNFFLENKLNKNYELPHLHFIAPSKWMANNLVKSYFFRKFGKSINIIPNIIPQKLNHKPAIKKVFKSFSCGSLNFDIDSRKGFNNLIQLINLYKEEESIEIDIFGISNYKNLLDIPKNEKIKLNFFGNLSKNKIKYLFNKNSKILFLSNEENLSNILIENLLNKNFIIAFNIGGNSEIVRHKKNGYLAKSNNVLDIIKGIKFSQSIDQKILFDTSEFLLKRKFSNKINTEKHINLYFNQFHE